MKHTSTPVVGTKLAYSAQEAGDLIGVSLSKVWGLIREGDLESFKSGKSRRITHRAIEDYLARMEAEARKARKAA